MADPTTPITDTPKPKASEIIAARDAEIASLRDQLAARDAEIASLGRTLTDITTEKKRDDELAAARAAEREKAIANKEAPKLIGTINVYLQDAPQDLLDRARPLFEGRVPIDRAKTFRIEGRLTLARNWPAFKRLGASPRVGDTFDVGEMPAEEIAHYAKQGVIVPIA